MICTQRMILRSVAAFIVDFIYASNNTHPAGEPGMQRKIISRGCGVRGIIGWFDRGNWLFTGREWEECGNKVVDMLYDPFCSELLRNGLTN